MTVTTQTLFDCDSPVDLMCRGFDREQVKDRTGTDIGYHGSRLKSVTRGVDRGAYKAVHVAQRVDEAVVEQALTDYAAGASKEDILTALGLWGPNITKLKGLFADLGRGEQFATADRQRRSRQMKAGMAAKYGTENAFDLQEFQDAAADTRQQRYGARYTLAAGSSLADGARETFAEKMRDPEYAERVYEQRVATRRENHPPLPPVQGPPRPPGLRRELTDREKAVRLEKFKATNRAKYGYDFPSQRPERRQAMSEFMRENAREFAEKSKQTQLDRYGVVNHACLPHRRAEQSERMSDAEHQRQVIETKKANGTVTTSSVEDELHGLLVEQFGAADVVTQYRDERYPFACDFYVPSRDLFIELNGSWTHGGRWYEEDVVRDAELLARWRAKDGGYHRIAEQVWTVRDVVKRQTAAQHSLNYVVLWDGGAALSDARLWLAMGAPDGTDWAEMYSWLPQRELNPARPFPATLDETSGLSPATVARRAARAATGEAFHAREVELWSRNEPVRPHHWGTLQARLYANRYRYLDKLPEELTDVELLRGMTISGVLRGYTSFDNTGMLQVLDTYDVTSVYDPCAGWGERLVTCAARGVDYRGTDVSVAVVEGHERMVNHYGLTRQRTSLGDAAQVDMRRGDHDCVFTCPPYGDIEIYTADGAENLDEAGFLDWWVQVVQVSVGEQTRVFAYQVNQRWRDRMNEVLVAAGWRLVEQIPVGVSRVSHFHREKGGKSRRRDFEEIQVFVQD